MKHHQASSHSRQKKVAEEKNQDAKPECFVCDQQAKVKDFRVAMTLPLHAKLQRCVEILLEDKLLAKLSAGAVASQDHMYHVACLTGAYSRGRGYAHRI